MRLLLIDTSIPKAKNPGKQQKSIGRMWWLAQSGVGVVRRRKLLILTHARPLILASGEASDLFHSAASAGDRQMRKASFAEHVCDFILRVFENMAC